MPEPIVSEDLIVLQPDVDPPTADRVITLLCERLVAKGYVEPSYCQAVLERERRFPTGLPTLPYHTAIPHADADGVKRTGVAIAILEQPIPFRAMDDPDKYLDIRVVLLIAVADPARQISMLQWVCTALQNQDVVEALASAQKPEVVLAILNALMSKNTTKNIVREVEIGVRNR